ncbi:uncharacterized protein LOC105828445 [Monomorium pharaonis]|uniref:uncharacterized protein LOC105828445 n=1 Tax=Monomorium pharaonis TaxID=307658 RepID=UPI00063F964E|nr:uncharacterized protein LOC105828445 [Monomorium pharaonis]
MLINAGRCKPKKVMRHIKDHYVLLVVVHMIQSLLDPLDDMLRQITPEDFEKDKNRFDSDAMRPAYNEQKRVLNEENYLLDPVTRELISEDASARQEVEQTNNDQSDS